MDYRIRRIVTTNDPSGKAVVLLDGPAPNIKIREETGFVSTLLWVTDTTPPDISSNTDAADREIGVPPPAGGSIFRVVEFPPEKNNVVEVNRKEWLKEMRLEREPETDEVVRHPNMHRTESIDYAIIMTGEIDLLLDDSDAHLKAGDVVVQRATNHAWMNRGDEPCKIAFILIDAQVKAD